MLSSLKGKVKNLTKKLNIHSTTKTEDIEVLRKQRPKSSKI